MPLLASVPPPRTTEPRRSEMRCFKNASTRGVRRLGLLSHESGASATSTGEPTRAGHAEQLAISRSQKRRHKVADRKRANWAWSGSLATLSRQSSLGRKWSIMAEHHRELAAASCPRHKGLAEAFLLKRGLLVVVLAACWSWPSLPRLWPAPLPTAALPSTAAATRPLRTRAKLRALSLPANPRPPAT